MFPLYASSLNVPSSGELATIAHTSWRSELLLLSIFVATWHRPAGSKGVQSHLRLSSRQLGHTVARLESSRTLCGVWHRRVAPAPGSVLAAYPSLCEMPLEARAA